MATNQPTNVVSYLNVENSTPYTPNGILIKWVAPVLNTSLSSYSVKSYANGVYQDTNNVSSSTLSMLFTSVVENVSYSFIVTAIFDSGTQVDSTISTSLICTTSVKYSISGSVAAITGVTSTVEYPLAYSSISANGIVYPVTSMSAYALYNNQIIKSFTMPNSVTSIGTNVFENCANITSLILSNNLQRISQSAISFCKKIISIKVPESVLYIDQYSFVECTSLTNINLPTNLLSIGNFAFQYCKFYSIIIPSKVNNIPTAAFDGVPLSSVYFAGNIPTIQGYNFSNPGGDTAYYIQGATNVSRLTPHFTVIQELAPTAINNVTVSVKVNTLGTWGTNDLLINWQKSGFPPNIQYVKTYEDGIYKSSYNVYGNANSLLIPGTDLIEGKSYTFIVNVDGKLDSSLSSPITYSNSVLYEISDSIASISSVKSGSENPIASESIFYNNISYPVTSIKSSVMENSIVKSFVVPNSVTTIGSNAFKNSINLTSLTLPSNLIQIGTNAFEGCSSLVTIDIPASVTQIYGNIFLNCTSLSSVTVNSSNANYASNSGIVFNKLETELVYYPIGNTSTKYIIPSTVTRILNSAIYNASALLKVYFNTTANIPTIEANNFNLLNDSAYYYVNASNTSSLSSFFTNNYSMTAPNVSSYLNVASELVNGILIKWDVVQAVNYSIIVYANGIQQNTIIVNNNSYLLTNLTENINYTFKVSANYDTGISVDSNISDPILYTESVKYQIINLVASISGINNNATAPLAYSSISANGIVYPVKSINASAMQGTAINNFIVPNSVTSIGENAFRDCVGLTNVILSNNLSAISDGCFNGCNKLPNITLPSTLISIGDSSFAYCSLLTSITIPNSVTSILSWCFFGCSSLPNITLPVGLNVLNGASFAFCTALTSVNIPNTVISINEGVFQGCNSLTNILIPYSVTNIENRAFYQTSNLNNVIFEGNIPNIIGGENFNSTQDTAYYLPGKSNVPFLSYYFSNVVQINATVDINPPKLNLASGVANGICVSWSSSSSYGTLTNYSIQVYGNGTYQNTVTATSSENSKVITGLTDGVNYTFRVLANYDTSLTISSQMTSSIIYTNRVRYEVVLNRNAELYNGVDGGGGPGRYPLYYRVGASFKVTGSVPKVLSSVEMQTWEGGEFTIPQTVVCGIYNFTNPTTILAYNMTLGSQIGTNVSVTLNPGDPVILFDFSSQNIVLSAGGTFAFIMQNITNTQTVNIKQKQGGEPDSWRFTETSSESGIFDGANNFSFCAYVSGGTELNPKMLISSISDNTTNPLIYSSVVQNNVSYTVTGINPLAFTGLSLTSIINVTLPNSITSIPNSTFLNCANLSSVTIPNSTTSIGLDAFKNCNKLTNLTLPLSLLISSSNIQGGSLSSLIIPNTITRIGNNVLLVYSSSANINIIIVDVSSSVLKMTKITAVK